MRRLKKSEAQEGDEDETTDMNPKTMPIPTFIEPIDFPEEEKENHSETNFAPYKNEKSAEIYRQNSKDDEIKSENRNSPFDNYCSENFEKHSPNDESQIDSRRISTPTYSSSLGSLTSPVDTSDNKSNLSKSSTENYKQDANKVNETVNKEAKKPSNVDKPRSNYLNTNPMSLRRNSYTKAIFFENG